MQRGSFFPDLRQNATDEEVVEVVRFALMRGGRLPRLAELFLTDVCAEHLVEQLRLADLEFVKRATVKLHE